MKDLEQLESNYNKLNQYVSSLANQIQGSGGVLSTLQSQQQTINGILQNNATAAVPPVGNLLWNGEIGHSVNSWNDGTYVVNDTAREAAWWFSHNIPATSQTFTTISVSNQIPLPSHTFTTGCSVNFLTTGALPTGLSTIAFYYVIVLDANNIAIATTPANAFTGTATTITSGSGTGTQTIQPILISTDARSSSVNTTLKSVSETTYLPQYSRWDSVNGQADLTGTMSVDQILPTNNVDSTTPLARVSFIAAKKNDYIEIPDAALLAMGIWDNTSGQRKFLTGDIGFNVQLIGATGSTVRKFVALLTSDRGYTLLSPEITISNSVPDGSLSDLNYLEMSWLEQSGQLQVELYEHYDPSGVNQYRLIAQVSSATSFIYEGDYITVVPAYPTPTGNVRTATFITQKSDMAALTVNGEAPFVWDTVNGPINVPNNYNKGVTTNRQWLRIWMTQAANLFINGGVTTDGSVTITIPDGAVDSSALASGGYGTGSGSLYAGLVAQVYDENDTLLVTTTVTSVTSNTVIVLGASVVSGTNRKLRLVAGGFHGILMDKIHLGYQQNTSYTPNADDNRFLQPVAAPASSDQGGVGGGGTGGGINPSCSVGSTPIKQADGTWKALESTIPGEMWASAAMNPNQLGKLRPAMENVRRVRSTNGIEIVCTDTEQFTVNPTDTFGTQLFKLRVGDSVVTEVDGRIEVSTIAEISEYLGKERVYTPSLSGNRLFIAGKSFRRTKKKSGFVLHNKSFNPANPN